MKKCVECGDKKAKKDKAIQIYLCGTCSESDKYKLICKSDIKNIYCIDEDNLSDYQNYPIDRGSYPTMTLYYFHDVIDIFCSQYKIDKTDKMQINNKINELEEEKEKLKEQRRNKLKEKKLKQQTTRKAKLIKELGNYGLKLRNDSKLCNGYIDGTISDWNVKEIATRMCHMKYLYDYCHMDDCYNEAYESQQEELNAGYFPDCTVFEQAELIALDKYSNGKYPIQCPWINYKI